MKRLVLVLAVMLLAGCAATPLTPPAPPADPYDVARSACIDYFTEYWVAGLGGDVPESMIGEVAAGVLESCDNAEAKDGREAFIQNYSDADLLEASKKYW